MHNSLKISLSVTLIFFLSVIHTHSQPTVQWSGKVIDYKTKEVLPGVSIKFYKGDSLVHQKFTVPSGHFHFQPPDQANRLEFKFLGYIKLVLEDVTPTNLKENLNFNIQLTESPFNMVEWKKPPTRIESRDQRRARNQVKRGVKVLYENGCSYKMKYSNKLNTSALYLDFVDLSKCIN